MLVLMDTVLLVKDTDAQIELIRSNDAQTKGIDLARALFNKSASYPDINKILKDLAGEEPETVRRIVLGYASAIMRSNNKGMMDRAYLIISAFRDNYYDCGKAGLDASCYEVFNTK